MQRPRALPLAVQRARYLRRRMTAAERVLWCELRNGQLGVSFRRQHPFLDLVLDFYAPKVQLAVEVDGPVHDMRIADDVRRDATLARVSVAVLRFSNDDVFARLDQTLGQIRREVLQRRTKPPPPRNGPPRLRGGS